MSRISAKAAMAADSPFTLPPARRELSVASADGTRIHVEEHGPADRPTVVLIHGWTCSTIFWAPLIRNLSADFRVVAYDQRGHGRSDTPDREGYSTRALADDLTAVLEAVVPAGERAVLVGHSMGGMTLMAASGRAAVRARTAATLLASTGSGRLLTETQVLPARFRSRKVRDGFHRLLLSSRAPLGPVSGVSRAALKYGVMAAGSTPEQVAATARVVHACASRPRSAWGRVLAGLDLDAALVGLTAPTAVLVGTADKLTPPVHARGMAAALPNCVGLTELAGLGHMTPVEGTDAVADVVRGLVRDHLASDASELGAPGALGEQPGRSSGAPSERRNPLPAQKNLSAKEETV